MRILRYVSAFLFLILLMLSCGNDSVVDPPVEPELSYLFSEYIHIDTTNYIFLTQLRDSVHSYPSSGFEPHIWYEQIIGEPFTDLNGNGVYDPGVDLFIRSIDSTNQDLNYDGFHNGTEYPWTPGVPFDDLDGDGICWGNSQAVSYSYRQGFPYYDINNNGSYDNQLPFNYSMIKLSPLSILDTVFIFERIPDTQFIYTSDSGIQYICNLQPFFHPFTYYPLYIDESSSTLGIRVSGSFIFYPIIGDVIKDTTFEVPYGFSTNKMKIEIITGDQLTYNGTVYSDLLVIKMSNLNQYGTIDRIDGFYFSKQLGYMARSYHFTLSSDKTTIFYIERVASVPLLMTKP